MVLVAAAVCTKSGKVLVSRQFVEMTKSRIEGLLLAFPKLMASGKAAQQQHTFVETDSVRYVYQPLEKLYVLLITTKASNILEDLESLRLFARVIPEYCKTLDEADITDNSFQLIFAFDEIVALGYRENVNLSQIRTFTEMDSHDEKVYKAVIESQMKEQKKIMREKADALKRAHIEATKRGGRPMSTMGAISSNQSGYINAPSITDEAPKPSYPVTTAATRSNGPTKALRLGGRVKDVDAFVDQLKSEGEYIMSQGAQTKIGQAMPVSTPSAPSAPVTIKIEEEILLTARRDGGLQAMEVNGLVKLDIADEQFGKIRMQMENRDTKGIQMQTHPNVDKELFKARCQIALKNPDRAFPRQNDLGILRWKFQTTDDKLMPLSINCWPADNGRGGCDVNIEYELQDPSLELNDVVISIPLVPGIGAPTVTECEGDYSIGRSSLEWKLPLVDSSSSSGSMEFTAPGNGNDFFPIKVSFTSSKPYVNLRVLDVVDVQDNMPVKYSSESLFVTKKYEIV